MVLKTKIFFAKDVEDFYKKVQAADKKSMKNDNLYVKEMFDELSKDIN